MGHTPLQRISKSTPWRDEGRIVILTARVCFAIRSLVPCTQCPDPDKEDDDSAWRAAGFTYLLLSIGSGLALEQVECLEEFVAGNATHRAPTVPPGLRDSLPRIRLHIVPASWMCSSLSCRVSSITLVLLELSSMVVCYVLFHVGYVLFHVSFVVQGDDM